MTSHHRSGPACQTVGFENVGKMLHAWDTLVGTHGRNLDKAVQWLKGILEISQTLIFDIILRRITKTLNRDKLV